MKKLFLFALFIKSFANGMVQLIALNDLNFVDSANPEEKLCYPTF